MREIARIVVKLHREFRDTELHLESGLPLCVKSLKLEPHERTDAIRSFDKTTLNRLVDDIEQRRGNRREIEGLLRKAPRQLRVSREDLDLTLVFGPCFYELSLDGKMIGESERSPNRCPDGYVRPRVDLADPRYLAAFQVTIGDRDLMVRNFKLVSDIESNSVDLHLTLCPESYVLDVAHIASTSVR